MSQHVSACLACLSMSRMSNHSLLNPISLTHTRSDLDLYSTSIPQRITHTHCIRCYLFHGPLVTSLSIVCILDHSSGATLFYTAVYAVCVCVRYSVYNSSCECVSVAACNPNSGACVCVRCTYYGIVFLRD